MKIEQHRIFRYCSKFLEQSFELYFFKILYVVHSSRTLILVQIPESKPLHIHLVFSNELLYPIEIESIAK